MMRDYIYDTETYPNVFTLAVEHADSGVRWAFEISDWRNDSKQIIEFLTWLKSNNARMVGFNNLGFDYPILHQLIRMGQSDAVTLYRKAQAIIQSQDDEDGDRWVHQINPSDRFVEQLDLYKIHHFDNRARSTSLKMLEFNMRADRVVDLPFPVGSVLTHDQMQVLKQYNQHDVAMTKRFYHETSSMIAFREQLSVKYDRDFMNHNDTKIGKDYFVMELEKAGVACYDFGANGRTPRQTKRPHIALNDAILPWIRFESPEFNRVVDWLRQQVITETKGVFNDLVARVDNFEFVFGLGGIHGSVSSEIIESDADHVIIDIDVTSCYPNLAITQKLRPAHLGEKFCDIYSQLFEQRKTYAKTSAESAMLKLALNGVYGDSNNKFSVFYDPLFTMSITLNGQLFLCLLAEACMRIDGSRLIQCNTDGLTVCIPRIAQSALKTACQQWEQMTGLTLEQVVYQRMFIRDVNNYLALREDGKVKRKGAYEHDLDWHQNHGALVIPKVAERVLVEDAPIRTTVENWSDRMDFMLRTKVPRSSYLAWGEQRVPNISRYYITHDGAPLFKWMPPLKGKTEWRKIGVESGWRVQVCNDIDNATEPINFDYYIREIEKLTLGLA